MMDKIKFDFWELGFRPFFLIGTLWSLIAMFLWIGFQDAWLSFTPFREPIFWHAHEMIFGFTVAIIAGFVLTASQNWSGKPGVTGTSLKVLFLLWFIARIFPFFLSENNIIYSLIDLAFLPYLSYLLLPYLGIKEQKRNWWFFLYFLLLFLANLIFHLESFGVTSGLLNKAYFLSVHTIVLVVLLIGGRVVPFFTGRVLPEAQIKKWVWLEKGIFIGASVYIISHILFPFTLFTCFIAFVCCILNAIRFFAWSPWKSYKIPVLWILHFAYLWIIIAYFLSFLVELSWYPQSVATHAFTSGVIGIFIYGMMTRVSLGHTGRPIQVSKIVLFGYVCIILAAFFRVFGLIATPQYYKWMIHGSGWFWVLAMVFFVLVYTPILITARKS